MTVSRFLVLLLGLCAFFPSAYAQTLVLAGGGSEGDSGDLDSWSYQLYRKLVENGDRNNDGIVRVSILATEFPSNPSDARWLPDYFVWIGQTLGVTVEADNILVDTRARAEDPSRVGVVAHSDVVFIKGGDQGLYYDLWNNTLLETHLNTVYHTCRGAIGGSSAGAMSLAGFSFSGGADMISADVLLDSHSVYLNDVSQPGTSGIHADFFGFLTGTVVDTHFTQRGRLGRLAGLMAKAGQDFQRNDLLGIGLEINTGIFVRDGIAQVIGNGAVSFLQETSATQNLRDPGRPLVYTALQLDRLTHGWTYDLQARRPVTTTLPAGVESIDMALPGTGNSGALTINGAIENDRNRFAHTGTIYPEDYSLVTGNLSPRIESALGFTDAGNRDNRMDKHETLFHLLYDRPRDVGFLLFDGGTLSRTTASADIVSFQQTASLVIDAANATWRGLSPVPSNWATNGGALRAAALTGLRLHVLAESEQRDLAFNTRTRILTGQPDGGSGGSLNEQEPNDSRSTAMKLEKLPVIGLTGTIATSSDLDYFEINLAGRQTVTVSLTVPAGADYDLYLIDDRGRTKTRSVNDGHGANESLTFTNGRRARTYYVTVESYSGSDNQNPYQLSIETE